MDMRRRDLPARPSVSSGSAAGIMPAAHSSMSAARPGIAPAARPAVAPAPRPGVAPPAATPGVRPGAAAGSYAAAARPQAKGDDLQQVMRQLTDLLTKENAALKRHRFEEVKEF